MANKLAINANAMVNNQPAESWLDRRREPGLIASSDFLSWAKFIAQKFPRRY
jgi:hypothetical protein